MAVAAAQQPTRMRLVFGVLAAIAILGFSLLGRWQWHRADEKRVLERAFAAGQAAAPAALGSQALANLPRYAHVEVRGSYDTAHQFLLDNISRDGRAGYEVLTPFLLDDGRISLVNRGWLPLTDGGRDRLPDIALRAAANRRQIITARVDELPVTGLATGRAQPTADARWPKLTSFPRAAELAAALGRPIESRQLLLDAAQPDGYRRDWQPASASFGPERHVSYAIQWWSLALLVFVIYVYMSVRKQRG
jgi:surfeit locus 1 family protein